MPRKKRIFIDTSGKKGKKLAKNTEKQVKAIVRRAMDNRIQDNYFHGHLAPSSIPGAPNGTPFQLTTMAQGDALGQRNGTGVMVKRLQMRVKIGNPATATPADYIGRNVRFVVVRVYKQDPAFQPNFGLVYGNGTGASPALQFPKIQERLGHNKEITVLYDRVVNLNDQASSDQRILYVDKKYKKPTGVYYDGSNRNTGQFWAIVIFGGGTIQNPPAIEAAWKVTYEDA